jgi:hypothetical protein
LFALTTASFLQKCDHNIGFAEKRQFFRRKLAKIAENFDHNIDPWPPCGSCLFNQLIILNYRPIYWRDSISRPIIPVSSVAGRDDTTRQRRQGPSGFY